MSSKGLELADFLKAGNTIDNNGGDDDDDEYSGDVLDDFDRKLAPSGGCETDQREDDGALHF